METFADRLNKALQLRNMTASELSKRSGVNEGAISQYRAGAYKASQSNLDKLSKILNVQIPWLMGCDVPMQPYIETGFNYENVSNILPIPKMKKVPRLGTIACGEPILAVENIETNDFVPADIKCDFTLKCKGDSMINARINDGDIVYIKSQSMVESGEIAACLVEGEFETEATLKRFYKSDDRIILQFENPKYQPFVFVKEEMNKVRIIGKAVGFTSKL